MRILHVFANKSNIGDYLSALSIKKYLCRKTEDVLIDEHYFNRYKHSISTFTSKDIIIVGGGGVLKHNFFPFWDLLIKNYCGYKLIIWGVGECMPKHDLDTKMPDNIYKSISKIASLVSVRDVLTQRRFIENGLNPIISGCPSTTIASSWPINNKKYLLHVIHPELIKSRLPEWRETCRTLSKRYGLKYIELFHRGTSNFLIRSLYLKLIKQLYMHSGMIISSRLHGVIIGSTRGVPVIPISNDMKINSYWKNTLHAKSLLEIDDHDQLIEFVDLRDYDSPKNILANSSAIKKMNDKFSAEVNALIKE
jgi:hypothetical protein